MIQGRPVAYLSASAIFHYLGPAIAVLLFSRIDALGVAWLRIASAAVVFAAWRRPWRLATRPAVLLLGLVLAAMNSVFYLALARLPLATVGAIEFLGVVVLAAAGARTVRNVLAVVLAAGGVVVLTDLRLAGGTLGFVLAFANCALFMLYVTLGHRIATTGGPGVDQLGAAMLVAAVVATPVGIAAAAPAFAHPWWLLAGIAVGISSSVIPYVTDQLAMARLRRSTFALMLCVLPAWATVIGAVVLGQIPTARDIAGIALVIAGVAVHQQRSPSSSSAASSSAASSPALASSPRPASSPAPASSPGRVPSPSAASASALASSPGPVPSPPAASAPALASSPGPVPSPPAASAPALASSPGAGVAAAPGGPSPGGRRSPAGPQLEEE